MAGVFPSLLLFVKAGRKRSSVSFKKNEFLNGDEVQVEEEVAKQMVKQIVQAKLRDRRCKLKRKHFNKSTEEERKNCPIPCMTQED
ncbi:hypothetical protein H6P81_020287 [Aristolochia fimbriata]|uniref:Uncharacterized protein n=1 Tax=Aristolochia fimbriata TaxID=158543 RepID=A0AAV7DU39_ARIFI|nr:hypothetical protein H6P81_020287 [Aristolochia fimbriata]